MTLNLSENIPLSLYVHLPWCVKKCPYCDFNSHAITKQELTEQAYIDALTRDLHLQQELLHEREIQTIFFGGGTPSLFSGLAIQQLMENIKSSIQLAENAEVTLEANPGTVDAENFNAYFTAGINRLSIGVQSFNSHQLEKLGRIHTSEEATIAVHTARQAGFENINIDIMFGLPGQTENDALDDLNKAIELKPKHISWYQLTIEPNTVFYKTPPILPDTDALWKMQQSGQALLSKSGYEQYEVSAYAKPGYECLHNLNYWMFGDYLAIGAGAHGKISDHKRGQIHRTAMTRVPDSYIQKSGSQAAYAENKIVDRAELPFEFMLNALRLTQGFRKTLFLERTGLTLDVMEDCLNAAMNAGLLEDYGESYYPTDRGKQFLNDLMQMFLQD